jgi:hypothetical protein
MVWSPILSGRVGNGSFFSVRSIDWLIVFNPSYSSFVLSGISHITPKLNFIVWQMIFDFQAQQRRYNQLLDDYKTTI